MAPFPGNRPQNPTMILQQLIDIEEKEDSSTGKNTQTSPTLKQERLNRESTKGSTAKHQTGYKLKTKSITRIPDRKSRIKLINNLIVALTMLLLAGATSQFYGFWRYGLFPTDPIFLLQGLKSSLFLDKTLSGYFQEVNAIALTRDGQTLVGGSLNTIKIWNLQTGELRRNIQNAHQDKITTLGISHNGKKLVTGSADQTIRIWDLKTGKLLRNIPAHDGQVKAITISSDGQKIVSVGSDKLMKLWNIETGSRIITRLPDEEHEVNALAFSPNGQILVTGSSNGTIRLWTSTLARRQTLEGHTQAINAIAISPDNNTLASASEDGTIKIWDLNTGEEEGVIVASTSPVKSLVFSADSRTIVSGGEQITLWDTIAERKLQTFFGHSEEVTSLAITPDGKSLVSGSLDRTIKVWRIP